MSAGVEGDVGARHPALSHSTERENLREFDHDEAATAMDSIVSLADKVSVAASLSPDERLATLADLD